MKAVFFLLIFLIGVTASANNPGVSYQGRIFKPDGNPLEGSSVQFRMQVRSPGSENCLLYEEVQTMNMAASSGIFSITMNDGSGTRLDNPDYQVDRIFANRDTMTLDATRCSVGTTYTPNSGDGRKFVVYFKDETMGAYEPLPIMSLNYSPQAMYALEAQKVDKFSINNILRTVDVSGNPVTAPALDPTQLTNLTNLLAGTSTQYATTTQFNTVQTFAKSAPPTCGAGEVLKSNGTTLSCVTDSTAGAPAYSAITGATGTNTIDNTNFAQTWNWSTATTQSPMTMNANALTTGSVMNVSTSSASLNSTNGLLNVSNTGASTNGILARFQSNSTAGSGLTVLTNGNVGIGTATPTMSLSLGDGSAVDGSIVAKGYGAAGTNGLTLTEAGAGRRFIWYAKKGAFRAGGVTGAQWDDANIGNYSASTGIDNTVSGYGATSFGWTNTASGGYSFAVGGGNTASGLYSMAIGVGSTASAPTSVAIGTYVTTPSYNQVSVGSYNQPKGGETSGSWVATDPLFVVGNGTSAGSLSTAMMVLKNGNVGIGTTNPNYKLTNTSNALADAAGMTVGGSAGLGWEIGQSGYAGAFVNTASSANNRNVLLLKAAATDANSYLLKAESGGVNRVTIGANGNVGIGTTTPQAKLDINGFMRMSTNTAAPAACTVAINGSIALTSLFTTCACKGATTTWVSTVDGIAACVWQ